MKKSKQCIISAITILLLIAILATLTACSLFTVSVKADDLMDGISANTVSGKVVNDAFINSTANFSIDLFKKTITKDKNSLISPTSVMLALAMTANGADNETLSQMEKVLGGIPIKELNEYLFAYVNALPNEKDIKLTIANSIWFRDEKDRLKVEKDFLQKNADYYNAAAYKSTFDDQTVEDINNWTNKNTDGMINAIIDKIDDDDVMYLINAIIFDAEWKEIYENKNIHNGSFTAINGSKQTVDFMNSVEDKYIDDGNATGFIKPYKSGYSFVALLPDNDIDINEYIKSLTGEKFINYIKNAEGTTISAYLPKFNYEYSIKMNDALIALGMENAFYGEKADFKKLGVSVDGNIYINEVFHKTFITVDERGTKAGAVTKIELTNECSEVGINEVRLDKPFVYAIIDNTTNLPVFIGTVMSIPE